jgi:hypothetical protein
VIGVNPSKPLPVTEERPSEEIYQSPRAAVKVSSFDMGDSSESTEDITADHVLISEAQNTMADGFLTARLSSWKRILACSKRVL